jgi:hypothetical protein
MKKKKTPPKQTRWKPPNTKTSCYHRIDKGFPTETVVGDDDRNFPTIYKVGRCFECSCIVAIKEGK